MIGRLLQLLGSFISRSHASLASVGVAALSRTVDGCGKMMSHETWQEVNAGNLGVWLGGLRLCSCCKPCECSLEGCSLHPLGSNGELLVK
jgi:hypothetical protein